MKGGKDLARYKAVIPKNNRYELAKKRERKRKIIDLIYIVCVLLVILITGLNQYDDKIVGIGFIAIGIISIPTASFHLYAEFKSWKPLFYYDADSILYESKESREKKLLEIRLIRIIELIFLVLFSTFLPILGALKLFGIF